MTSDRKSESRLFLLVGGGCVIAGAWSLAAQSRTLEYELTAEPVWVTVKAEDDPAAGSERTAMVQLQNTGRQPLTLLGVQTSCSCAVATPLKDKVLQPGESAELELNVHLPAHGLQRSVVRVATSPPVAAPSGQITLTLIGREVETPYIAERSPPVQLTARSPGDLLTHVVSVSTGERIGSKPWITGMVSDLEHSSLELIAVTDLSESEPAKVVRRRYDFQLTCLGPETELHPRAFSLHPVEGGERLDDGAIAVRVSLSSE